MRARKLKQVQCAIDVGLGVELRLRERWPYASTSGEVNDDIEVAVRKDLLKCRRIPDVSLNQPIIRLRDVSRNIRPLYVRRVKLVKIVDDRDLPVAFAEQPV